jgi:hypothetical protein
VKFKFFVMAVVSTFALQTWPAEESELAQGLVEMAMVGQGDKSVETYDATMFSTPGSADVYGVDIVMRVSGGEYIRQLEQQLPDVYPCDFQTVIGVEPSLQALQQVKDFTLSHDNPKPLSDGMAEELLRLHREGQIWIIIARTSQTSIQHPDCNSANFQIFMKDGSLVKLAYYLPWD